MSSDGPGLTGGAVSEKSGFRAIITGGGVAGLLLANALERANVDYVVLERRNEAAPFVGASICMVPNGCRILDQLGYYEPFTASTIPVNALSDRDNRGVAVAPPSDFGQLVTARTGYQISFGDRQRLLDIMYEGIQDKTKIHLNKKVVKVIHSDDGVAVRCEDGTQYTGDVLLGADGVYSKTREALWDLAQNEHPDLVQKDRNALSAQYQCLFGISSGVDGLNPGDGDYGYDNDRSSLIAVSKNGRTYFFIFQKMKRTYREGFPHYTRQEAEEFAQAHFDMRIRPNITFEALWKTNIGANLVVLEEGTFKLWTHGRIACVGDSVHKQTPNLGYGGNAAIESAAALANRVKELADRAKHTHLAEAEIKEALASYQQSRSVRAEMVVKMSATGTRLQALQQPGSRVILHYAIPMLGDFLADMQADVVVGAESIDFLPIPTRSVKVNMPFNHTQGDGLKESKIMRLIMIGIPLLSLMLLAGKLMDPAPLIPWATTVLETKILPWTDKPLVTTFYHLDTIDNMLAPLLVFFSPLLDGINPVSTQALLFLVDFGPVIAIWCIESARRANALTFLQLPILFTLSSQFIGVGVISPLYYLLHYTFNPIENFKSADMRLTRVAYTKTVFLATLFTYFLPLYLSFFHRSFHSRLFYNAIWQLYPIWMSIASYLLFYIFPDTTKKDRINNVMADLPAIRFTIGALVLQSASLWMYTFSQHSFSLAQMAELVLPPLHSPQNATDLITFAREFLLFDSAFLFGNTFIWLGYLFWDIKHAGMLEMGWAKIVAYFALSLVAFGPGATAGLGFLWREECLATRRHWAAMTNEKARERNRKLGVEWEGESKERR